MSKMLELEAIILSIEEKIFQTPWQKRLFFCDQGDYMYAFYNILKAYEIYQTVCTDNELMANRIYYILGL